MNNDYLRVNSKNDDEEIVVGEFKNEEKNKTSTADDKKVTLLSLFSFSRKENNTYAVQTLKTPNIRGLFTVLFLHVLFAFSLCFISFLTSDIILLILSSVVATLVLPFFTVSFAYKLDTSNGVSTIEIILGLIVGVLSFILLNFFEPFVIELIYYDWIREIISVILRDTLLFITATLFVKAAKKDNMFDAILLTVTVYAGYIFVNSLQTLIESMFVSVQVFNGTETVNSGAIILGEESFQTVFSTFFKTVTKEVAFLSVVVSCSAIVNGGLIGLNVSPIKDDRYKEWSLYSLFVLTVILHIAAVFPSSIRLFEVILKTISIVFSLTLAITIINYYLSKAKFKE